MSDRILIVDDDPAVLTMLEKVVCGSGLEAETAADGKTALELIGQEDFALMLLDINMQGIDGFEVIRRLREQGKDIPIIVVSGRKEDYDALYGLEIGADDYITKPFNPVTLGAKLKAMIRRSRARNGESNEIIAGPFRYDTGTLRLYKNGTEIELSAKENVLVKLFLDHINRVFPRESIYEMVWGNNVVDDNNITVYINRIRQKIEDDPSRPQYLQTVRGLGYRFVV